MVSILEKDFLPVTQFSIYKIDLEEVEKTFNIEKAKNNKKYIDEIENALIKSTEKIISKKLNSAHVCVQYQGFNGIIFKTVHYPIWKNVAQQVIAGNERKSYSIEISDDFLSNSNISYLLLYRYADNIYVVTGGYGSNYISKFTSKNFGLYLLPKIIKRDNPVLKQILENNLTGNRASTNRANRKSTSFITEQDMSSIFRQLSVEVDRDVAKELGVTFREEELSHKKIGIINKDSLVIRRSFTLRELKKVIEKVSKLENKKDNFILNYLVLAKKRGIKNSELQEILIQYLYDEKLENFILVGDEYENYYANADKYKITDENQETFIIQDEPITLNDIFMELKKDKNMHSKAFLYKLLKKWEITTFDNSGKEVMYPVSIYDALQGFIEHKTRGIFCYLFSGNWYVFDDKYDKLLLQDYKELFDLKLIESDQIKKTFGLNNEARTEDTYNKLFYDNHNIIVAHTVLMSNVEIADMIFWSSEKIYLMHNKNNFDGTGTRDLTNQILTAAEYIQKKMSTIERDIFLKEYYGEIKKKYSKGKHNLHITEQEFLNAFNNKEICFIAGYLFNFKKNTRSTYSRYLTIDTNKKLNAKSFSYIPMNIMDFK